jgi:hypothetical protein
MKVNALKASYVDGAENTQVMVEWEICVVHRKIYSLPFHRLQLDEVRNPATHWENKTTHTVNCGLVSMPCSPTAILQLKYKTTRLQKCK